MEFLFLDYLANLGPWIYPLILVGMFIEGEAFLLIAAFTASQGLISLDGLLIYAYLGAVIGDILWHLLGRYSWRFLRPLHYITNKVTRPFFERIKNMPFWFILISKFTYGIHHLSLVRTGMMRMSLRHYLKIILIADIVWVMVITSLGYFFGASFGILKHYLKYGEVGLLLGLIVLVIVERLVRRVADEKI
jgi:membrane protein DedA with SNARE-associated domain